MPVGVEIHTVSDQTHVVDESVGEFTTSLIEAIVIVLAVNFLSLGWRPGIVVALCIPLVLAMTFVDAVYGHRPAAHFAGRAHHCAGSAGRRCDHRGRGGGDPSGGGMDPHRAAISAYSVTAVPMLVGTLITVAGFLPIAMSKATASEYVISLFQVIAISLVLSWIVAVIFTPFIAYHLLPQRADARDDAGEPEEQYEGRFYGWFRRCSTAASTGARRWWVALAMFVASMLLFQIGVPRQFFPASDRPELVVDLQLSQNASFAQTQAVAARMEKLLATDEGWCPSLLCRGWIAALLPAAQCPDARHHAGRTGPPDAG
jgi:multidrug efflux pump